MKDNRLLNYSAFLIALSLLMLCAPAWATERNNSSAESNPVLTAGDNIGGDVGGDRSYALGMGDVDINDFYRSWQFLIFQDSKPNPLALAAYYDSVGLYDTAARTRCTVRVVRKVWDSDDACVAGNTVSVAPPPLEERIDHDDEDYEDLRNELQAVRTELKALQDEKAKALARVTRAENVAQRAATRPQTVQYGITDEQRAELAEVFRK